MYSCILEEAGNPSTRRTFIHPESDRESVVNEDGIMVGIHSFMGVDPWRNCLSRG